jgi:hypothetical protein
LHILIKLTNNDIINKIVNIFNILLCPGLLLFIVEDKHPSEDIKYNKPPPK